MARAGFLMGTVVVGWAALGVAGVAQAEILGPPLIDRAFNDGISDPNAGQLWVFRKPFATTDTVVQWKFFDDNPAAGESITPLILTRPTAGGTWDITGIGAVRTSDNSGLQTFNFDLTSGSANVIGAAGDSAGAYYMGWYSGVGGSSGGTGNSGVPDNDGFGGPAGPDADYYTLFDAGGTNPATVVIGSSHNAFADFDRLYSIQFLTSSSVPEPATLGVLGMTGLFCLRRRRA